MFIPLQALRSIAQLDSDFAALDAVHVSAAVAAVLLAPRAAPPEHRLVIAPAEDLKSIQES